MIFDLNANHFEFDFNREGKFYFVCEKDKYESGFKLLFIDLEQSQYICDKPKEIFGNTIIREYRKEEIEQFLERGTKLGDCFKYDLFYFLFERAKKIDKCICPDCGKRCSYPDIAAEHCATKRGILPSRFYCWTDELKAEAVKRI